jgi:hypothetical protein
MTRMVIPTIVILAKKTEKTHYREGNARCGQQRAACHASRFTRSPGHRSDSQPDHRHKVRSAEASPRTSSPMRGGRFGEKLTAEPGVKPLPEALRGALHGRRTASRKAGAPSMAMLGGVIASFLTLPGPPTPERCPGTVAPRRAVTTSAAGSLRLRMMPSSEGPEVRG